MCVCWGGVIAPILCVSPKWRCPELGEGRGEEKIVNKNAQMLGLRLRNRYAAGCPVASAPDTCSLAKSMASACIRAMPMTP